MRRRLLNNNIAPSNLNLGATAASLGYAFAENQQKKQSAGVAWGDQAKAVINKFYEDIAERKRREEEAREERRICMSRMLIER